MDQRFTLDRTSFEKILATASLLQQLQRRALYMDSSIEGHAPQLMELVNTQQAIQTGTLSIQIAFDRISALAVRLIPAQGAGIWLFSGDAFLYRAGAGIAANDESLRDAVLSRLANTGQTTGSFPINEVRPSQVESLLVAPIYQGQKIAGALAVFSEGANRFSEQDETSTRLLSGLAAQALDKAANARFKQTVTLERAAVLHLIGTLVPSLEVLVGTKPKQYVEAQSFCKVESEANQVNDCAIRPVDFGVHDPGAAVPDCGSPIAGETDEVPDLLSSLRAPEDILTIQEASEPATVQGASLSSLLPGFEPLNSPFRGMSDVALPVPPESIPSVPESKPKAAQGKSIVPETEVPQPGRAIAATVARAKRVMRVMNISASRTRLVSWYRTCRDSFIQFVNTTATLWNELAARGFKRKLLIHSRWVLAKRLGAVLALIAAFLTIKASVSKSATGRAATTSAPSPEANTTKKVNAAGFNGSHKRITDAATSAALGDLSHFEIPGLLRQAQYGDPSAAFVIGMAYETGEGVPQNCEKAARWVKEAALGGDAAAEYNLSLRYRDGDGLSANPGLSEKWRRQAAEQKYAQASAKTSATVSNQTEAASSQP